MMTLKRLVCFSGFLLSTVFVSPLWAYEDGGVPVINGYESTDATAAPTDSASSLKQRLRRVEQQVQNQANLLERVNELQQTVQALEGKVDEQAHEIKQLKEQQQRAAKTADVASPVAETSTKKTKKDDESNYIVDADADSEAERKETPKKNKPVEVTNTNKVTDNLVPADDKKNNQEEKRYLAAYEMIKSKQFDKALPLMKDFIREFPESRYGANAHYWIGEILLIQGDADSAKTEFQIVTTKYPNSTKVPDAHLKLGAIYADKGLIEKARTELVKVQQKYPDTAAAKLATARLEALSE